MASRKKFIDVEIPILDSSVAVLGTPESLKGKTIKLDLTRKLRGKGLEILSKISEKEEKLTATPKKLQLMKSYLKRMMRKRVNYVEDSFKVQCKDIHAIIKPFLITRKKVSRAVRKNLRNTTKDFLIEYVKEKNYLEICEKILSGELQKTLLPKLKKIYPLSFCDIRVFETNELSKLEEAKPVQPKKEEKKEKAKEEELEEKKKTAVLKTTTKKK